MNNALREGEKELVEELLILNSIVYTEDFSSKIARKYDNVYDWAIEFDVDSIKDKKNYPAEINEKEFQTIIDTIKMNKEVYSKMEIVDVSTYKANNVLDGRGVNATIEYNNSYIVIYKGTAGSIDWNDNELGGYSKVSDTEQQEAAVEYFERMMDIKPNHVNKIYVTGHSKGGNKAQYVGVKRGDKIDHVYSFDGQNFNDTFAFKYNRELGRYKDKITNISNKYDFVNILFPRISGRTIFVKSNTNFGNRPGKSAKLRHKFGGWHSPYSMLHPTIYEWRPSEKPYKGYTYNVYPYKKESTYKGYTYNVYPGSGELFGKGLELNAETEQSKLMQDLEAYLDHLYWHMNEEDWRYLSNVIMTQMMNEEERKFYIGEHSEMPEGFEERLAGLSKEYFETNTDMDPKIIIDLVSSIVTSLRRTLNWHMGLIRLTGFMGFGLGDILLASKDEKLNNLRKLYEEAPAEGYALVVRDFTEETRRELLSVVEEVENEHWLNITKWDVFYRIEKYLKGLDFPTNEDELNTYYRKVIDLESTTKEQINEIFEQVYATDENFSKELDDLTSKVNEINSELEKMLDRFE